MGSQAETFGVRKDSLTGDAWPSSVRDLNCSLKWGNERNPRCQLQVSGETAPVCEQVAVREDKSNGS